MKFRSAQLSRDVVHLIKGGKYDEAADRMLFWDPSERGVSHARQLPTGSGKIPFEKLSYEKYFSCGETDFVSPVH